MADDIAVTEGSGKTVATADIGGKQFQKILVANAAGTVVDPVAAGSAAMAASIPVTIATNDYLLSSLAPTTASWTAAAAAYTAGDVVGTTAPQTLTTVGASGKQVMLIGTSFSIDSGTAVASAFRLHLYNATPTAIADQDPWTLASADLAKYLGFIDLGTPADLGAVQWIEQNGLAKPVLLSTANIIAYLEVRSAVTLAAVAHKVTLFTTPLS